MDRKLAEKEKKAEIVSSGLSASYLSGRKWVGWALILLFLFTPQIISSGLRHFDAKMIPAASTSELLPTEEAVLRVYAARTWGAKGILAVHSWIALKPRGEANFEVNQVIGWRRDRLGNVLWRQTNVPYDSWWGNEATLLLEIKGDQTEAIIEKVDRAIERYPYKDQYTLFPGPNSNTFVAWVGLQVPEMGLDLPSTAIGKDWRPLENSLGMSASGTGLQASLFGLLGTSIGFQEGLEMNILGLSFEADLLDFAIEIPLFGRYEIWYLILYFIVWQSTMRYFRSKENAKLN